MINKIKKQHFLKTMLVLHIKSSCIYIFPVVEEANWLNLDSESDFLKGGFDPVICLGNSFAHLPDFEGDLRNQRLFLLYCFVLFNLINNILLIK